MLVLARKQNEKILIGDKITLTVSKIDGNNVKILTTAPKDIQVLRGEVESEEVERIDQNFNSKSDENGRLVLSRTRGEEILISGNIIVKVMSIHGDKVRLGIKAPKNIPIHREEVYKAVQEFNGAADPEKTDKPSSSAPSNSDFGEGLDLG